MGFSPWRPSWPPNLKPRLQLPPIPTTTEATAWDTADTVSGPTDTVLEVTTVDTEATAAADPYYYGGYGLRSYGYSGLGYGYGRLGGYYGGYRGYYGKREAEAEPKAEAAAAADPYYYGGYGLRSYGY